MPPKGSSTRSKVDVVSKQNKQKPSKNLAEDVDYADETVNADDNDDVDNVSDVEEKIVSKERYEYKPMIIRDTVYVLPEERRTSEILTKFECTEIISTRAVQIEQGGTCFTDCSLLSDPLQMARKELMDKKCPLDVVRAITDVLFERWHVNEMGLPADF